MRRIIIKKRIIAVVLLPLLVIALAGVSQAWQWRMGDPYGLLQDESDFFTHPSKIVQGAGVRFYGHYRFTYTDVTDWDYNLDRLDVPLYSQFDTSGQEYSHNSLLDASFPLGPGRMGLFFTYDGMRGDYDGDEVISAPSNYAEYDLMSDLDAFAQRQSIEKPQGDFNQGDEVQIANRQEENENWQQINLNGDGERKTPADNVLKLWKTDKARIEWSTGEGVSVLFDL